MSAAKLVAKPYSDRKPDPPVRSIGEYLEGEASWAEAPQGDRGKDISRVRFAGLQRDLALGDGDALGGYLKAQAPPNTFIESVGNRMVLQAVGAQVLHVGEDGFSPIPRVDAEGEVYHPLEGAPITSSNMSFGIINPHPFCVGVSCDFSRMLPAVAGPFSERIILETLAKRGARAVDGDALDGSGSDGEPLGLLNINGVGSVDGAGFTFAKLLEMRQAVAEAHFLPTAALGNAETEALLRARPRNTNGDVPLLTDDGKLGGISFHVTEAMPAGALVIGDFSQLVVLIRSIQVNRNPYSRAKQGVIELDMFTFFDVFARHAGAFAKVVDLT